eukprot:CAMPEP_0115628042 /NCGR_PEP_ID=MMETSP0272-20121206/29191_1 /TAXON_ID=71861 /ORGANISM="Scrippsiella trochoidea, Strain CCMP3099" /LENGTH=761 /DNA_ID=CAMNT_0003064487 /DNA_START=76 /DNA_END=2361 /DNA_ORIENTATION=-
MASSSSQQLRLRPAAAVCARRLLFLCLLFGAVCAGIFSDFLLTVRLKGDWFFQTSTGEQDGASKTIALRNVTPARSLKAGDEVAVQHEFLTDSADPIKVLAGNRGIVLQLDEEGDAEINFIGLGREWVYSSKFPRLGLVGGLAEGSHSEQSSAPAVVVAAGQQQQQQQQQQKQRQQQQQQQQWRPQQQQQQLQKQSARVPPQAMPNIDAAEAELENDKGQVLSTAATEAATIAPIDTVKDSSSESAMPRLAPMKNAPAPSSKKTKSAGPYQPLLHVEGHECQAQALELGNVPRVEDCDKLAVEEPLCGKYFMFSQEHPDWKCRCCEEGGENHGPKSDNWNVYRAQLEKAVEDSQQVSSKEKYIPKIYSKGHECDDQAFNLGKITSPAMCDALVAAKPECGAHFMFSKLHPDWACRCCSRSGADDGPASPNWDVYEVRAPLPESRKPMPPAAIMNPSVGLPVADGLRPKWLLKEDALIIDGRRSPEQGGGILILQAVLMDASRGWGKKQGFRPRWLRAILAANREHARTFGHALIVRSRPTEPQLTPWQIRQCGKKSADQCRKDNERENYNWEKHLMLAEYLNSPQNFSHVMMLDADAAFIRQDHNTLARIVDLMDIKRKDLFLTDEDWLKYGEGRINGGLIVAKNTAFTRGLFQDTFDAHVLGPTPLKSWRIGVQHVVCSSNEQICLNDLWKGGHGAHFSEFTMMAGGKKWNHGAEIGGFDDPDVEILHFMGGSKGTADKVLCDGSRDVTGEGPLGYGCKK